MRLIVYAVIVTYDDYTEDLDNIFPTAESAILHAEDIFNHSPDIYKVVVDKDKVTEEYGRGWLSTIFVKKRED